MFYYDNNTEKRNYIIDLFIQITDDETSIQTLQETKTIEMFTIKKYTEVIKNTLSVSLWYREIRTGWGKRGKIFVNKADFVAYFHK